MTICMTIHSLESRPGWTLRERIVNGGGFLSAFYILKTGFRMIVYILLNGQGNLCEVVEIEFRVLVRIDTPMTCD